MSNEQKKRLKSERAAIYLDCILGSLIAILGFFGMAYVIPRYGIYDLNMFILSLIFWIIELSISLFLISLGIYTWYKEKQFDETKPPPKDLRPPIV